MFVLIFMSLLSFLLSSTIVFLRSAMRHPPLIICDHHLVSCRHAPTPSCRPTIIPDHRHHHYTPIGYRSNPVS
uniref:Putative secreted protein n=1 Tax=Anopheles darlingi TaxID=43151 RepID=A0A2M4DCC0_ANODA